MQMRRIVRMSLSGFWISYTHGLLKMFLNENLYKNKVHKIPETFKSPTEYNNSFIQPLLEETHSDLSSNLYAVSKAPFCELKKVERDRKRFKLPKALFYMISVENVGMYELEFGDLMAFTDIRPKSADDFNRPYTIGFVVGPKCEFSGEIPVLSSKCLKIDIESDFGNSEKKYHAVYLLNLTTNVRIWKALNSQEEADHLNITKKILQPKLNKAWKDVAKEYQDNKESNITMEHFVKQRFRELREKLKFCIETLYTHLPKSFISLETVKKMLRALDLLRSQ